MARSCNPRATADVAAGTGPVDLPGCLRAQLLHHKQLEIGAVVEQPVEVEQPLVDDVLVDRSLVLEDDRAAVLIKTDGVDPATVLLACRVLAGDELDTEQGLHVAFDEYLEGFLQRERCAQEFDRSAVLDPEELEITHQRRLNAGMLGWTGIPGTRRSRHRTVAVLSRAAAAAGPAGRKRPAHRHSCWVRQTVHLRQRVMALKPETGIAAQVRLAAGFGLPHSKQPRRGWDTRRRQPGVPQVAVRFRRWSGRWPRPLRVRCQQDQRWRPAPRGEVTVDQPAQTPSTSAMRKNGLARVASLDAEIGRASLRQIAAQLDRPSQTPRRSRVT